MARAEQPPGLRLVLSLITLAGPFVTSVIRTPDVWTVVTAAVVVVLSGLPLSAAWRHRRMR